MTVQQIIDEIIKDAAVPFKLENTCDKLVAGYSDAKVTSIVTTFMATVDVIKKAHAIGANLIITHEPTYFTGADDTHWLEKSCDSVYLAKKKLIEDTGIAIWRYHDYMHMKKPDAIYEGLLHTLEWKNYQRTDIQLPHAYTIPSQSVAQLCSFFKKKLNMSTIQIVGNPNMLCSQIGILVGGGSLGLGREEMPMEFMHQNNIDVLVCGEITEWTTSAYVNDAFQLGMNKAMIVLGHERTEEAGMEFMAAWLPSLVNNISVHFIDAKEPFTYL